MVYTMPCEEEPNRCSAAPMLPLSYCSMFTCFWHFWSWLEPPVTAPLASPAAFTMTSLKKGYGSRNSGQLKSPIIKRPLSAPVTLQGWLYKQGSEGLMLWKKRWFVLSEYCLFYYKTSEEEKLLGSILLPSYKISPCGTDDKVYRKFVFKAEHANMRTYYFAADSQPLMAKWMNALSLASILQDNTSSWGGHKPHSSHQQTASADDSDSGFHGQYNGTSHGHTDSPADTNSWRPPSQGYHQPLYANAPPKPRRLNDTSPERSPERVSDDGRLSKMAQPQEYTVRNDRAYNYTAQHSHRPPLMLPPGATQPQERRTPDTYGRSNSTTPQTGKVISSKPRTLDYEDVYQTNPDLVNSMYSQGAMYTNRHVQYRQNRRNDVMSNSMPSEGRKRFPPRPHSADFLEYDARRSYQSPTPQSSDSGNQMYYNQRTASQPRRPKSSLDIVHSEGVVDGVHWSEESYARKMRQSASYVSPQFHNPSNSSRATTPSVRQIPIMAPGYYNGPVNGELASSAMMRQHSEAIHAQERRWSEYVDRTNGQFVRSASARLPRHTNDDHMEDDGSDKSYQAAFRRRNSTDNRDPAVKTQQREESMKRLLEWKQRMLQSPLTRKSSGSSNRGSAQNQLNPYSLTHEQRLRNLPNDNQSNPDAWRRDGWDKDMLDHARARRKHSDAGRSRSQDGRRSVTSISRYNSYSSDDEASGSGSVIGRDPLPPRQVAPVVDKPPPPSAINPDLIHQHRPEREWSLQLSAGELLGRTHEELVLLLIQLRRQSAGFCKAMEACHMEIEAQARLVELETPKRMEHLQKLEDLKRHLLELEKQYEKGKPLVNLVDNMVKLGSLYRAGAPLPGGGPLLRDRLEFNHQVQERRLLAEERRDWERLSPDHNKLQAKVEQLYRLDRLLQEESGTLQSLQQDKEMLERALGGLRHKLQAASSNPVEAEKYRRQQRLLERELSRVRSILAHNSKKLEETVAENARLEQELVVLRQKLVWSRRAPDQSVTSTAQLEQELARVQSLVGDLQRQRLELSSQVRQLTERSNSLSQQIRPSPTGVQAYRMGYYMTYPGVGPVGHKKTIHSSWLETDLDTQVTRDVGRDSPLRSPAPPPPPPPAQHSPLYVNTDISKSLDTCSTYEGNVSQDEQQELTSAPPPAPAPSVPAQYTRPMDISEADDRIKRFYGIIPKDKPQEIKTVRIVKRESERRQRDRDRSGNIGIPLTPTTTAKRVTIIEENGPDNTDNNLGRLLEEQPEPPSEVLGGSLVPRSAAPPAPGPRSDSVQALRNLVNRQRARVDSDSTSPLSATEQLFGSSDTLLSPPLSPAYASQLSPVYQSQAARQIVEEMAFNNRRAVPREKRRHHTVSGRPLLRIDTSFSAGGSRDDLDMERALRPRLNTPDVVRSTLSRNEVKYTSETIDSLLGTPGKILIPERYVPESTPELSSEEQQRRNKKAESIRKMLSETTTIAAEDSNETVEEEKSSTLKKKVAEEKRQREHLLQLNQILAHQVMEKSKMVAVRALASLPQSTAQSEESDLSSPEEPLPLYQQRDNYFS
ncbi:uncharacterized protein LOC128987765 isoform X5 [Macrosteles quadrilineatus]|uniref:uncharacterized protein LOC128987765 isoform X5 n=1 Tax=Macrosteles quadrilineatus TaxID=74068 RepID=UPI0023E34D0B|nr:uncharacterized protein LOC128987765 isoform X5 [Macrosteles quadrilineatus]